MARMPSFQVGRSRFKSEYPLYKLIIRDHSSIGQSRALSLPRLQVQVLLVPPYFRVAQLVERLIVNQMVEGARPSPGAKLLFSIN